MTPVSSPAAPGVPGGAPCFCAPSRRGHARVAAVLRPFAFAPASRDPSSRVREAPRTVGIRARGFPGALPALDAAARLRRVPRLRRAPRIRGRLRSRFAPLRRRAGRCASRGPRGGARRLDAEARHAFFLERNARVLDAAESWTRRAPPRPERRPRRARPRRRRAGRQTRRGARGGPAGVRARSDACLYAAPSARRPTSGPPGRFLRDARGKSAPWNAPRRRAPRRPPRRNTRGRRAAHRERSKAADAATRAVRRRRSGASVARGGGARRRRRAGVHVERGVGFDDPANDIVWRGTKNVPVPADDPTKRREKDALSVDASAFGTEIAPIAFAERSRRARPRGSVAYTNLSVAAGAGRSLGSGPLDASGPSDPSDIASSAGASSSETFVGDGNAFKRSPKPSASTSEVDSTGVFERVMRALGGGGAGEATASPGEKDLGAKMSPGDADGRGDGDEPFGFSGSGFSVSDSIAPAPEWMYPRCGSRPRPRAVRPPGTRLRACSCTTPARCCASAPKPPSSRFSGCVSCSSRRPRSAR